MQFLSYSDRLLCGCLAAGLFREFIALDLNDTWMSMILVNAAFNLSFAVWIMHSFFATVPKEIEEAAWLDGCSRPQSMRRVMLPLVWPGTISWRPYYVVPERVIPLCGPSTDPTTCHGKQHAHRLDETPDGCPIPDGEVVPGRTDTRLELPQKKRRTCNRITTRCPARAASASARS